jgi:hypothetical protein
MDRPGWQVDLTAYRSDKQEVVGVKTGDRDSCQRDCVAGINRDYRIRPVPSRCSAIPSNRRSSSAGWRAIPASARLGGFCRAQWANPWRRRSRPGEGGDHVALCFEA